ncbi:phage portal protein [Carnobacteriaceae bacterium zg-ZUI252]|nr:phage portal protein [Carnobacteriaceae bacterium zg-ZUI252]
MGIIDRLTDVFNGAGTSNVVENSNGFRYLIDFFGLQGENGPVSTNAHLYNDIYACVNVLSDDVAKLPVKVYRKRDGVIVHESEHNIQYLLGIRPNPYMTPYVFKKMAVTDLCFTGNFYALKEFDKDGRTIALHPLTATATNVVYDLNTRKFYYRTIIGTTTRFLQSHEVIHIKGLSRNGFEGVSPVSVIAEQSKANRTAMRLNQSILESGGTPQGILSIPTHLTKENKDKVKEAWKKHNSKEAIAVLDNGMTYQQIGISQADLQFLEGQKFNQQQISAIYKVPLHKINQLDHATFTNIEHQSLDYVKNTLQPLVVQFEEELTYKLFMDIEEDRGCYVKFNLDSELRGDSESRAKVQEMYIRSGTKTINEIRAMNEDSPYDMEHANIPLMTLNYTRLDLIDRYTKNVNKNAIGKLMKGGEENEESREEND